MAKTGYHWRKSGAANQKNITYFARAILLRNLENLIIKKTRLVIIKFLPHTEAFSVDEKTERI
jgi:hypothetical protein